MVCGIIPHFIFFAAAFAELTGVPFAQATEENACNPLVKISWSTSKPEYLTGHNVTMFCEVNIGNATLTNSTEVEWSVKPHRSLQKNVSFQHQVSDDGMTIKAILTLRNVTKDDIGPYTITFRNMCDSKSCTLSLNVEDACLFERPDPVQKEVTISASLHVSTLKLAANFTGATDQTQWRVIWSNSTTSGLGFLGGKYHTRHHVVSDCFFTEELIIHNVSRNDAGWYFANVYNSRDTGVNTTFYVNIMDQGREKKEMSKLIAFISVCAVVLPAIGGVIGVIMYFRLHPKQHSEPSRTPWIHKINPQIRTKVEEKEECNYVFHTKNASLAALSGPSGCKGVFFLYCKTDVSDMSLVNLADILDTHGISSCLDITTESIPANWRTWAEEKIDLCDHVIHVCTRPLYRALRENINDMDNDHLVEMFKGEFSACAVVNHIRAPKFIPVFLDCNPDKNVVPTQLKTHHFFHLRIRELMQAVEGKPMAYVDKEISENPLFRDIKQLIDLLQ